jgi:GTP-binding protein LepA
VIAYIKVVEGTLNAGDRIRIMNTAKEAEILELGVFRPEMTPFASLAAGEVGYIATGLKVVSDCQVGDTITQARRPAAEPLPGFRPQQPMVFAGLYPLESEEYPALRDALDKLKLNDSSLVYEPESSDALGFGFRCGFLGLLHMEIVQERIEREFNIGLLATAPSVEYEVLTTRGEIVKIDNPSDLPDLSLVDEIREPWMDISIIAPKRYIGALMELVTSRRGEFEKMDYLDEDRVHLTYKMPLGELIVDFYDELKSRTQGYASLDYTLAGLRASALVKLDILVNGQSVDALSMITHRDEAYGRGRQLIDRLRALIPRQMFDVPLQASIGSRIIARETIRAMRKNVIAKCYGGDVSRKRKLLEKQKEGKSRMKMVGSVEIPQEAFMAVLSLGEKTATPK